MSGSNSYYNPTGNPQQNSQALSVQMRAEFNNVAGGFALFPVLSGNAGKAFVVNPTNSGVSLTVGTLSLAGPLTTSGALTTTGAFNTTFAQTASVTLTLPGVAATLATLAGTETLSNKTLVAPTMTGVPTAPTAAPGTNTTQVATCAFVEAVAVSGGGSVAAETARAMAAEALLAPLASPALTGVPTAPTAALLTNSAQLATCAFVANATAAAGLAPGGLIHGLTLSNDGTTPNTVLDIAAGTATDAGNTVVMPLNSAMTKSISSAWAAGTGHGGMGTGLTATASTWYHVFLVVVSGSSDVYFDTSASAANSPAGTTAHRRIGSFLLDSSGNIIPFVQNTDRFDWVTPPTAYNGASPSASGATLTLQTPLGVVTQALLSGAIGKDFVYISSLAQTNGAVLSATTGAGITGASGVTSVETAWGVMSVCTDTNSSVRVRTIEAGAGGATLVVFVNGWIDVRGR